MLVHWLNLVKRLTFAKALAYCTTELITAVKSFMIHTPSLKFVCKVQHSKGPYTPILNKLKSLPPDSFLAWGLYYKTYYGCN
jgi:hypothetical protein